MQKCEVVILKIHRCQWQNWGLGLCSTEFLVRCLKEENRWFNLTVCVRVVSADNFHLERSKSVRSVQWVLLSLGYLLNIKDFNDFVAIQELRRLVRCHFTAWNLCFLHHSVPAIIPVICHQLLLNGPMDFHDARWLEKKEHHGGSW